MWTRFSSAFRTLLEVLHEEKMVGDIRRVFCDFAANADMINLEADARQKRPSHDSGSLLAYGVFSLTWGLLTLDEHDAEAATKTNVQSAQVIVNGIDVSTSIILTYPYSQRQGIITSSMLVNTAPTFLRIEGSAGKIVVEGKSTSNPSGFVVSFHKPGVEDQVYQFKSYGEGFAYEADAAALDIAAGKTENRTMSHAETLSIMRIMDGVRKQNGALLPQDE